MASAVSKPKRASRKRKAAAKPRGGPAKLTDKERKKFLDAIRLGLNKDDAALLAGIKRQTFFDWQRRGRADGAPDEYLQFVLEMDLALIEFEQKLLGQIHEGAKSEWPAAMTLLERKWPDRYGRRTRHDVQVTVQTILASPEWVQLRDTVIAALAPYPQALDAVLKALAETNATDDGNVIEGVVVGELTAA